MEELVLEKNMQGCSDPARQLLLLFFHFFQHLEESLSASEWWGHPKVIQSTCAVLGNPHECGWSCCGSVYSVQVHLTCKAGITNTALRC